MEPETYDMNSSNYQMNLNQPLQQDLNSAQNYNYNQIQRNVQIQQGNPIQQSQLQPPVQQPQGSWMDWTGQAGKIAYGVKSLVDSQDEKRKAKVFSRISKEENDRRLEAQRQTGYGLTPYSNERTWSMKKGGMYIPMPSPSYQDGGQIDSNSVKSFDKEKLKAVQMSLKSKGLYKGKIDGVYGPKTELAIKYYNSDNAPRERESPYELTTSDNNPSLPHVTNRTEMQKELDNTDKTRARGNQMLPDFMNKNFAENFLPISYESDNYSTPFHRAVAAQLREKDPSFEFASRNAPERFDAWNLYLNQPQKNKTFKISKYTPDNAKSSNEEYYDFTDGRLKTSLIKKYAKENFDRKLLVDDLNDGYGVMGHYTIRKKKDSSGNYISYEDKWDLENSHGVGKPFDIIGRAYYDPETGEQIPEPESQYQQGGLTFNNNIDQFLNSYNNQLEQQQMSNQMFQDHYDTQNDQKKMKWKDLQKQGVSTLQQSYKDIQAELAKAVGMMQDGGEIEMDQMEMDNMGMNDVEQLDTESLYSPDFQSPYGQEQEPEFEPEQSLQSSLESWIFQDNEPPASRELSQAYDKSFSPISYSSGSSGSSSMNVIDSIKHHESRGNPEAENMIGASGYYQFTPEWADKIAPFMGLPANTPKAKVMEAFRKNPKAQDDFMQYVVEKIYKPEIERQRPLINKYGFSDNEMIKLLHYRGVGDTRKRLRTGDFEVSQKEKDKYNNPDILTYIKSK